MYFTYNCTNLVGEYLSDDERYEPVPLGFGIEAAPPSYKAAISKKNESIFKVICLQGLMNGEEGL